MTGTGRSCRGAALVFALLGVVVVSSAAAALQTRTAAVIRRARTDRERAIARLLAESRVDEARAGIRAGACPQAEIAHGVLRVTLVTVPGRLPRIVRWSE